MLLGEHKRVMKQTMIAKIIYAVSLMDRTGGYGPSDMGSIPVLRATCAFNSADESNRLLSGKSLVQIQQGVPLILKGVSDESIRT